MTTTKVRRWRRADDILPFTREDLRYDRDIMCLRALFSSDNGERYYKGQRNGLRLHIQWLNTETLKNVAYPNMGDPNNSPYVQMVTVGDTEEKVRRGSARWIQAVSDIKLEVVAWQLANL